MNCLECEALLQRRLDGEKLAVHEALERHWLECPICRDRQAAALRLLEGLKQLPRPRPAAGFAQALTARVLQDRRQRRDKLRRRVSVTLALAASILVLLAAGYYWMPRLGPENAGKNVVENPPKKQLEPPLPEQPHARKHEPRNAIASLTERWADTTRNHAAVVLVAADLDGMEKLPAMKELPPLDPGAREATQEVTDGVRAVTRNTRRAFDFFARELPMPEVDAKEN